MTFQTPERELETQIPNKNPERFAIISMYIINVAPALLELNSWLCVTFSDILWVRLQGCSAQSLPPPAFAQWWPQWTNISMTGEYRGENERSQAHVQQHPPASKHTFREKPSSQVDRDGDEPFQTRLWPGPTKHLPVRSWISACADTRDGGAGAALSIFHQFFMYRRHIKWQPLGSSSAAFPPQNRDSLQINILLLPPALPSSFQT